MAAVILVGGRIDDGKRIVDQLVRDGFEVTVALWVQTSDEGLWRLYIASPLVDALRAGQSYPALFASLSKVPDSCVQLTEINLVNAANPIARDAIALRDRHPAKVPIKYRGKRLGDLSIKKAYIYPPTKSLDQSMKVTVYGLFYKGIPSRFIHLSLEPHDPNVRMIVESEGQDHEYPADTSLIWVAAVPEGATLERDKTGRLVLAWDLHGERIQSDANEIFSFAHRGLYGFQWVSEPA